MTLWALIELTNYIAGKYPSGQTITPERLNLLLPDIQDELYGEEMDTLLKMAAGGDNTLLAFYLPQSYLKPFKENDNVQVGNTGIATLPTDYVRFLSVYTSTPDIAGNEVRRIVDVVSEAEFNARCGSALTRPEINPFAKIMANNLMIVPYTVGYANLDYLRRPTTPYFDFVQPSTNPTNIIYLNAGNSVETANAALSLFDVYADEYSNSNGDDPLYTNVYYSLPAYAGVNYRARTRELEWDEWMHYKFVSRLLAFVGINLTAEQVEQFAQIKKGQGA